MKELLFNPFLLLIIGGIVGAGISYYYSKFSLRSSTSDCTGDFTLAKSKIISTARAVEMYESYTTRRARLIEESEGNGYETTRFGSIDFAIMNDYIDYLNCINTGLKSAGSSGIKSLRVYFANYPDQFANGDEMLGITSNGMNHSYAKRNTFFMLPTLIDDNQEKGFKVSGSLSDLSYETIDGFLKNTTNKALRESEVGSLIFNEVGLTPPPPGQDTDF